MYNLPFFSVLPPWNEDLTCGPGTTGENGVTSPAECNPDETEAVYCCSSQGVCGSGAAFCDCNDCYDWRPVGKLLTVPGFSKSGFPHLIYYTMYGQ